MPLPGTRPATPVPVATLLNVTIGSRRGILDPVGGDGSPLGSGAGDFDVPALARFGGSDWLRREGGKERGGADEEFVESQFASPSPTAYAA
jgi:hypothetical protein